MNRLAGKAMADMSAGKKQAMSTGRESRFPSDMVLERLASLVATEGDGASATCQNELAAAVKERIRLAHLLHERLLQSLAGAALQLEASWQLIGVEPGRAREIVRKVQKGLLVQQRELREWVESTNQP